MWNNIRQYIEQHQLLNLQGHYLVAVSGGADSVCLLLILKKLGYQLEAVHCNFHLRGSESDRDESFVKTLCEQQDIPLHLLHFDTQEYATLHKISIEMAARQLRYRYFEQLRHDIGADAICVAHHRDDSVETMLINLLRGTGIHGLVGIRPKNGYIVRPLLCVSRSQIVDFLKSQGQEYVTDSTNLVDDVVRNKIRLNVIPMLQCINPAVEENMQRTAEQLFEAEQIYNNHCQEAIETLVHDDSLSINELKGYTSSEAILFEWLSSFHFSPAIIRQIYQNMDATSGRLWSSPTHDLIIDRGRLVVEKHEEQLPIMRIPESGNYIYNNDLRFSIKEKNNTEISRSENCASLDAEKVSYPLTIRPIMAGDRFIPFGMKGSKLVSDFLTDKKMSLFDRRRQLVVTDANSNILWLVGQRPDARYCISDSTHRMLLIQCSKC